MTKDEALKMALDVLVSYRKVVKKYGYAFEKGDEAITDIKEALAQPEQEPLAWYDKIIGTEVSMDVSTGEDDSYHRVFGRVYEVMLEKYRATNDIILAIEENRNFTSPPKRQPLTKDQVDDLAEDGIFLGSVYEITRAVEAAHVIKEK